MKIKNLMLLMWIKTKILSKIRIKFNNKYRNKKARKILWTQISGLRIRKKNLI
jgi:hypothetical protein